MTNRSSVWSTHILATRTHYEVLGVSRTATQEDIRRAYRALARSVHPDVARSTTSASETMAEVNSAWSVLSDPVRRREYDRSLDAPLSSGKVLADDEREMFFNVPTSVSPARFPWRGALFFVVLGIVVVLVLAAFVDPEAPPGPDQLLSSGSCVDIDATLAVREVDCSGSHDAVVRQLIAFDAKCPNGSEPYRDSQGMGTACVDRVPASSP